MGFQDTAKKRGLIGSKNSGHLVTFRLPAHLICFLFFHSIYLFGMHVCGHSCCGTPVDVRKRLAHSVVPCYVGGRDRIQVYPGTRLSRLSHSMSLDVCSCCSSSYAHFLVMTSPYRRALLPAAEYVHLENIAFLESSYERITTSPQLTSLSGHTGDSSIPRLAA